MGCLENAGFEELPRPLPVILEDACRREMRVLTKGVTMKIADGH